MDLHMEFFKEFDPMHDHFNLKNASILHTIIVELGYIPSLATCICVIRIIKSEAHIMCGPAQGSLWQRVQGIFPTS